MSNPIEGLHKLGQSLWYDNIQRKMLENGEMEGLINRGDLRGMTSNPSIFNHAIANSHDYDEALKPMAWSGYSAKLILDRLIIEDIRNAADLFLPLYKETNGGDGYVSIEVGPEMAHDTEATLVEAHRLWDLTGHPNVMVKIPATREGIPAIRQAIADGLNINITLIFSLARYAEVMDAYLSGLEERLDKNLPIDRIASVASFFISRIDSKVDTQLEASPKQKAPQAVKAAELVGTIATASAKLAYAEFKAVFESPRFARLKAHGARLQRPLWASTSTKNPAFADTKYVDALIGPNTVNTVPPATLDAFRDHGTARLTIEEDLDLARQHFKELAKLGISIDQATQELEDEGVRSFTEAFTSLLRTVDERRKAAVAELGALASVIPARVALLEKEDTARRMQDIDPSLWTKNAAAKHEIRKRLGWLTLPEKSRELIPDIHFLTTEVRTAGYTHALLLGMGGSSLAPEVMRLIFGVAEAGLNLAILDSTDPTQVRAAASRAPIERTLYIVSSKSGDTAEVGAFLDFFWDHARQAIGNHACEHFIAITDPGSSLETLARERSFRKVFLADPKVGGRYSALSAFGLVPAGLMGIDLDRLLDKAAWMQAQCLHEVPAARNPGLVLSAVLGEAYLQGRDKLTLIADPDLAAFGGWLEQLVAESSGKEGKGILPVDGEPLVGPSFYGTDRLFVHLISSDGTRAEANQRAAVRLRKAGHPVLELPFDNPYDLGAAFYRWEYAIAVACAILGVNAFDQPDVQDAKNRTYAKVEAYRHTHRLDEEQPLWQGEGVRLYGKSLPAASGDLKQILSAFLGEAQTGDYVAVNAYIPRNARNDTILHKIRKSILERTHLATTSGFGPRFQHSTGQIHKGGKNNGLFLEITARETDDLEIPGQAISFGAFERAQALGDLEALQAHGRRALRIHLQDLTLISLVAEALGD
jgi:transaldolase / glucose-6-phosphate isomerase